MNALASVLIEQEGTPTLPGWWTDPGAQLQTTNLLQALASTRVSKAGSVRTPSAVGFS
jgi:hypothetical protein